MHLEMAPCHQCGCAAAAAKARQVEEAWSECNWDGQQLDWENAAAALQQKQQAGARGGAAAWQARAHAAEQQLMSLYELLLALPDPGPTLGSAAALSQRAAELEAANRKLQAAASSAAADADEVTALLAAHEQEKAAHAALREEHAELQVGFVRVGGHASCTNDRDPGASS